MREKEGVVAATAAANAASAAAAVLLPLGQTQQAPRSH